ncbi:Peptidase family M50 [Caulifigura coniformis]|uniref:Peptidase family M50 n=1 Tax=Caulifigura coniformis TaxID=2527983 RepID=A0A517SJN4_9PLAN|nr:site-2 protease family protein [Caulifigura coniformis]QDT56334.1 Peptidase family M50 [Caulifigura coniformis]
MDSRSTPFFLSFPLGTWFQTQVRVSLFFFLVLIYCLLEHPPAVGATIFGLLFVSVLAHEFGHIFAARWSGGEGEDILMWPLGGLAYVRPANNTSSELLTHGAGPLTNAVLCGGCLAGLVAMGRPIKADIFSLLTLPAVEWQSSIGRDVLVLAASINFKLFCVNLLPALPMDGGQITYAIARTQGDAPEMRQFVLRLGMVVSIGLVLFGWLVNDTTPIVLAFFLVVINLHEHFILALTDQWSDGFAGAEFGASLRDDEESPKPGVIARWRMRRAQERQEREAEERIQTERKVDELLAKVHSEGMNSLTDAEKRFLTRASQRYRNQEH